MLVGYTRISKVQRNEDLRDQKRRLQKFGCDDANIYTEQTSQKEPRLALKAAMDMLRSGDKLVVDKLSHLGFEASDIGRCFDSIDARSAHIVVLDVAGQVMDTSTKSGQSIMSIVMAVSDLASQAQREAKLEGLSKTRKAYRIT